jgi:hypothetical protein
MDKIKLFSLRFLLVIPLLFFSNCATVPKESLELNRLIGKGIDDNHQAQINLLNKYFEVKKKNIDNFIENEYLPKYIINVQATLAKNGMDTTLDYKKITDIIQRVISKRDSAYTEIDKTRILIQEKIDSNYQLLAQANSGLTSLLQSAISVNEAESEFTNKIKSMSSGTFDLDAIDKKFSGYLTTIGNDAGKGDSLYNQVKNILNNSNN